MSQQALCYHCGLPVKNTPFYLQIRDVTQVFCCVGCQMVAQVISENGLLHYYEFRDQPSATQLNVVPPELLELSQFNLPDIQQQYTADVAADTYSIILSIDGITCAACVWLLERRVAAISGVVKFTINLTNHRAELLWRETQVSLSEILFAIAKIGFRAEPFAVDKEEVARKREYSQALKRLAVSGFGFGQVMMFAAPLYSWFSHGIPVEYRDFFRVVSLLVTTPVLIYCGRPFFTAGWRSLRSRLLSMDVSISIALLAVYIAGLYATIMRTGEVYFDSITMFLFFITLSRYLEMRARHQSGLTIQQMSHQQPTWVTRVRDNTSESIALGRVQVDDVIIIKSGSSIPVDGVIVEGIGSVNESLLTGESLPKSKMKGEMVVAGSLNVGDPLLIQVTRVGANTTLAAILKLFERAQFDKPRIVSFTQQVSHYFVLVQLLVAAMLFLYWLPQSVSLACWTTISLLVISCPCALAVATPVALTSAMSALSRKGFFCTRGHVMEGLVNITDIVFDKTGTLTEGKFSIHSTDMFGDLSEKVALHIAAALESQSEHPIASAFKQNESELLAQHVKVYPNRGVAGEVNDVMYYLGNAEFIHAMTGVQVTGADSLVPCTRIYLANRTQLVAAFNLQDNLRPHSKAVIQTLTAMGYQIHLLSGDHENVVRYYANELGIMHYFAECSPGDKLNHVKRLQQHGAQVLMLGDGINDAPVLMQAHVSIAMASGADLTRVSSDAVLMKNDLSLLPGIFQHAKRTHSIIRQCLLWAVVYNIVCLPLALTGLVVPYVAAILMSMSSILVVVNALRLLKMKRSATDVSSELTLQLTAT